MRTYGRLNGKWVVVQTDASGGNDLVWIVTLIQCLLLYLNESPFWANYGIPARDAVASQIVPDLYVTRTQQQFSPYFASLIISKQSAPEPTYRINVLTLSLQKMVIDVGVPQ